MKMPRAEVQDLLQQELLHARSFSRMRFILDLEVTLKAEPNMQVAFAESIIRQTALEELGELPDAARQGIDRTSRLDEIVIELSRIARRAKVIP